LCPWQDLSPCTTAVENNKREITLTSLRVPRWHKCTMGKVQAWSLAPEPLGNALNRILRMYFTKNPLIAEAQTDTAAILESCYSALSGRMQSNANLALW